MRDGWVDGEGAVPCRVLGPGWLPGLVRDAREGLGGGGGRGQRRGPPDCLGDANENTMCEFLLQGEWWQRTLGAHDQTNFQGAYDG